MDGGGRGGPRTDAPGGSVGKIGTDAASRDTRAHGGGMYDRRLARSRRCEYTCGKTGERTWRREAMTPVGA